MSFPLEHLDVFRAVLVEEPLQPPPPFNGGADLLELAGADMAGRMPPVGVIGKLPGGMPLPGRAFPAGRLAAVAPVHA